MTKKDLRIVYLGTPEFAVASLQALVEGGYNVVAVVTMPDKPAGRGHQVQFSDVKKYALSVGLPVLQPEKLKDEPPDRRSLPYVAGGRMGDAAAGYVQPPCVATAAVPRCGANQLGGDERRQRDRGDDLHAEA